MLLSAIIVSYNVKHYVAQCIDSLLKASKDINMEIFVVDNHSTDGTQQHLQQQFSHIWNNTLHFIANTHNVGFGKANNQAYAQAKGKYILYINPDTFVSEDTLHNCLSFFEQHADAGIVGVRMLNHNGTFAKESRRGIPTPATSLYKFLGLAKCFPHSRIFGKYYLNYLNSHEVCKIEIVSGAFMMIPRSVLQQCGSFDEDFFMYGEDVELSYRILKAGYQNYYLPTRILHYKGESTNKKSIRYINVFYKAMLIFFRKHYPKAHVMYALVFLGIYLLAFKALLQQQLMRLIRGDKEIFKADYAFIGSPQMLQQAQALCEQKHIRAQFFPANGDVPALMQTFQQEKNKYTFVIFDVHSFSYQSILQYFDETPRTDLIVGTWHNPETILPGMIKASMN